MCVVGGCGCGVFVAPGLFSALLTREKALRDRCAVRLFVGIIMCVCVGVYGNKYLCVW